jgi:hypothetical protein
MRPLVLFACIAVASALSIDRPAAQTPGPAAPLSLTYKGFVAHAYNGPRAAAGPTVHRFQLSPDRDSLNATSGAATVCR